MAKQIRYDDFTVLETHDGDTTTLRINIFCGDTFYQGACRLLGINCPELKFKDGTENPAGTEAQKQLAKWMKLPAYITAGSKDKYGRPLITIFVSKKVRGSDVPEIVNVNDWMLANGYAEKMAKAKQMWSKKWLHLPTAKIVHKSAI